MIQPLRTLRGRLLSWGLLALCLSGCLVCAGCPGRAPKGTSDDLFISSQRFNIDEDRGLVRVYGRLDNTGKGRFAKVEVHAILRSGGGDKRGENNVTIEDLKPGERRNFAMTVTSHDRVSEVELEVRTPGESWYRRTCSTYARLCPEEAFHVEQQRC